MTKLVCCFFEHPAPKGDKDHKHICKTSRNITHRCGYSEDDWMECPLSVARLPK
jgi:hypothetical protein